MKVNKIYLLSTILILASIAIMLPSENTNYEASWAYKYSGVKELYNDSTAVIVGNVVSSSSYKENGIIWTKHIVKVSSYLKGDDLMEIAVIQTGGHYEGKVKEIASDPIISQSVELILFLTKGNDGYFVLGGPQGRFVVVDNKVYSIGELTNETSEITSSVHINGLSRERLLGLLS